MPSGASVPHAIVRHAGHIRFALSVALSIATMLIAVIGAVVHAAEATPQAQDADDWARIVQLQAICAMVGDDPDPDD